MLNRGRENGVPVVEANVGVSLVTDGEEIVAVDRRKEGITFANITIPAAVNAKPSQRDQVEQASLIDREQEMERRYEKTINRNNVD